MLSDKDDENFDTFTDLFGAVTCKGYKPIKKLNLRGTIKTKALNDVGEFLYAFVNNYFKAWNEGNIQRVWDSINDKDYSESNGMKVSEVSWNAFKQSVSATTQFELLRPIVSEECNNAIENFEEKFYQELEYFRVRRIGEKNRREKEKYKNISISISVGLLAAGAAAIAFSTGGVAAGVTALAFL